MTAQAKPRAIAVDRITNADRAHGRTCRAVPAGYGPSGTLAYTVRDSHTGDFIKSTETGSILMTADEARSTKVAYDFQPNEVCR